jgi:hypothetical protein
VASVSAADSPNAASYLIPASKIGTGDSHKAGSSDFNSPSASA